MKRQTVHLILLAAVGAVMMAGCTGREAQPSKESQQPQDTVYTQQAAMAVYGYQPERALEIVDSAVIVGNISEVWADVNRARIYSQMETDRQRARADNIRLLAVGIFVIALLAIGFAVILLRKNRDIRQKNRVLAQQLTELYDTGAPRQTGDGLASGGINEMSPEELYRHIRDEVIRLQLYTDPGFGRQSIIERFHLTKDQASRVFSQGSEHSSISDFINNCRLDHARRLLISRPDMSISDIATASGFGLRTTFTRNFKARHGLTPSEFREQQEQS